MASEFKISYEDYVKKLEPSLQDDNTEGFLYERKDHIFYIYRKQQNITIQLSKFNLKKIDYVVAAEKFIDDITKIAARYKNKLADLKEERKNIIEEKNKILDKLEKFVNLKEDTENELYSKFILILNEKKKIIQHMQEMISAHSKGYPVDNEELFQSQDKNSKAVEMKSVKQREAISDSDSDEEVSSNKITHKAQIEPNLSSKRKNNYFEDDIPSKISLPKRVNFNVTSDNKQQDSAGNSDIRHKSNNLDVIETSCVSDSMIGNVNELTKQICDKVKSSFIINNKVTEKVDELSIESEFDFNTQDLMDRL